MEREAAVRRDGDEHGEEPRYIAAAPATLVVVPLDSLTAVYHRASGITHLLDAPAPQIIEALDAPMTVAHLLARLSADYDLRDADPAALADRLAELAAAGLVARV